MTVTEKKRIEELFCQGLGYRKIASSVGLSENTVKSYCKRNLKKNTEKPNASVCKNCGRPVKNLKHKKAKKFCCDECRLKWWDAHRNLINRTPHHFQICPICKKEYACFSSYPRYYCSRKCYADARKKEVAHG